MQMLPMRLPHIELASSVEEEAVMKEIQLMKEGHLATDTMAAVGGELGDAR